MTQKCDNFNLKNAEISITGYIRMDSSWWFNTSNYLKINR